MSTKDMLDSIEPAPPAGALAHRAVAGNWGTYEGDVTDILIPKLLIGQSTSKLVQDEKLAFGQVWRSTTGEVMGGKGKAFQVIPLSMFKTWVLSEKVGGKFEFRGVEPFTPANKDREWVWTEKKDGKTTEWKRVQTLNFHVLLPADVATDLKARRAFQETGELPDTQASLLPCVLQFQSTGYKVGKILATHFAKAADFGVPPFVNTFLVDTDKVTGDQNSWYVFTVTNAGKTSPDFLDACAKWRGIVAKPGIKIDDSDLENHDTVDVMTRDASGAVEEIF